MASPRSPSGSRSAAESTTFDAIFRAHIDYVWRAARTLAGSAHADDITQEVFLVVRRRLDGFQGRSMKGWLYGITRNVAHNTMRAQGRRARRQRAALQAVQQKDTTRWPEVSEAADLMDRFLAQLPARQREAFVLKEIEELTAAEIAEATGTALQTVYSRVKAARRALEQFRDQLEASPRERGVR